MRRHEEYNELIHHSKAKQVMDGATHESSTPKKNTFELHFYLLAKALFGCFVLIPSTNFFSMHGVLNKVYL